MSRTSPAIPRTLSVKALALIFLLCALAVASIPLFLQQDLPIPPQPEQVNTTYSFDSTSQRTAHRLFLLSLAGLGLFAPYLGRFLARRIGVQGSVALNTLCGRLRTPRLFALLFLLPLLLIANLGVGRDQFLVGVVVFLFVYFYGNRAKASPTVKRAALISIGLLCAGALAPSFFTKMYFGPAIESALWHYYAAIGQAPLLADGRSFFANISMCYGLLPQTILAVVQRGVGPFGFGDYIRVVQAAQVLFAGIAMCAYALLERKRVFAILFCLLLWLPWITTGGSSVVAPTQSGLRFLFYAIFPLILLLVRGRGAGFQAVSTGLVCGLAVLHNVETGICITLACLGFNVVSERASAFGRMAWRVLCFVLGLALALGLFSLLCRIGLGAWPSVDIENLTRFLSQHSSLFSGIRLFFDPKMLVALLFPALLLLRLTLVWYRHRLSERMRFKFAICILLLCWLAYYFNRPHNWNLWTHTYLLTFLVLDIVRLPKFEGSFGRILRQKVPLTPFLILLAFGPSAINDVINETKATARAASADVQRSRSPEGMELFSGVWLDAACANDMRAKSDVLSQMKLHNSLYFVSANQMLLQWQNSLYFDLPFQDLYLESHSDSELRQNAAKVVAAQPDFILLDSSPACPTVPLQKGKMLEALPELFMPSYEIIDSGTPWLVLKRREPGGGESR